MNPTSTHEDAGLIPGPHSVGQGSGVAMSCGFGPQTWLRSGVAAAVM